MTSNNLTIEEQIDDILQDSFVGLWMTDENGDFVQVNDKYNVLRDFLKQQLLSLIQEEKIKGMLKMVETANCMLQADEPAIDEIWFDLDMPDDSIIPMRQDTMLSELKHRLQALKQPKGDK